MGNRQCVVARDRDALHLNAVGGLDRDVRRGTPGDGTRGRGQPSVELIAVERPDLAVKRLHRRRTCAGQQNPRVAILRDCVAPVADL